MSLPVAQGLLLPDQACNNRFTLFYLFPLVSMNKAHAHSAVHAPPADACRERDRDSTQHVALDAAIYLKQRSNYLIPGRRR